MRQSHVISNGSNNNKDNGNKEVENGDTPTNQHSNKHQPYIEKSETVSKATGAATAQGVSKYQMTLQLIWNTPYNNQ